MLKKKLKKVIFFSNCDPRNRHFFDESSVIKTTGKWSYCWANLWSSVTPKLTTLITLTETLIIPDITKTESNNCFIILYLQVISQFLAGSMKRIEKPFLLRCLLTWHCCPRTWHCSWKSCIARATYRLFTNL